MNVIIVKIVNIVKDNIHLQNVKIVFNAHLHVIVKIVNVVICVLIVKIV